MMFPPPSQVRLAVPLVLACLHAAWSGLAPAWESELYGPGWQATPALSFETDKIIQDFSYAGYRRGELPLPSQPAGLTYDVYASYAIRMSRVRDGWIRNVKTYQAAGNTTTTHILNNGILLTECARVTVKDCHLQRPQFGGGGGAGYMYRLQNSGDCLIEDSVAEFCRHGIVFSHMATTGNVIHACIDKYDG